MTTKVIKTEVIKENDFFVTLFLIIGALTFAKKLPDILKEFGYEITEKTSPEEVYRILQELEDIAKNKNSKYNKFTENAADHYNQNLQNNIGIKITSDDIHTIINQIIVGKSQNEIFEIIKRKYVSKLDEKALEEFKKVFNSIYAGLTNRDKIQDPNQDNYYSIVNSGRDEKDKIDALRQVQIFRLDIEHTNTGVKAYKRLKDRAKDIRGNFHKTTMETKGNFVIFRTDEGNGKSKTVELSKKDYKRIKNSGLFINPKNNAHGIARFFDTRLKKCLNNFEPKNVYGLLKYLQGVFRNPAKYNIEFGFKMSITDTARGCVEIYMPDKGLYVCVNSKGKITTIIPINGNEIGLSWKKFNVTFQNK